MKSNHVRSFAAVAMGVAALGWNAIASAQTVVVQPHQQPAPAPASSPVVVSPPEQPAAPPPPPSSSSIVVNGQTVPVAGERSVHPETRPNRTLLMTGLVLFGAPYIASVGIAAGSPHTGDSDLWVPVLGPWLDLGVRGGCPSSGDCGSETADKVLLVGDGILQTIGALEIAGAFIFPETREVTTITTGKNGESVTFSPSRLGLDGYGLSAVGQF